MPCNAFLCLRSKKKIDEIQKKDDMTKVMLEIISRQSDNINLKVNRTDNLLKGTCEKHVWPIIKHTVINNTHLNGSGVHLNKFDTCTSALARNFITFLKDSFLTLVDA